MTTYQIEIYKAYSAEYYRYREIDFLEEIPKQTAKYKRIMKLRKYAKISGWFE